ncbi:hypothetical protein BJV82DRAFT_87272 [Fennellomyces sp. T-0311]|nr:hypothetical protein BJV82DRAFT_87272 [Fennellomyces sp. T-0311]
MWATDDLPRCLKGSRCIIHIDLDCFYCQVEEVRLGLSSEKPVAVQQWQGLIAVNYAAREFGVGRHSTATDAKKIEITLVHVATYGPTDQVPHYYPNPSRATHKVSLDPYRQASKRIFNIFQRHCSIIQKIGLDEGFMDMTAEVNKRIIRDYVPKYMDKVDAEVCDIPIDWEDLAITIGEGPTTWHDLQLAVGAEIAAQIRKEIFDELHYTCSAGIAHAKVAAKLCSSKNKPNKQTILRKSAAMDFMREIPFTKIRNMGGKLGNEVESELGIEKAGDVWQYELKDLQERFGQSTGLWIYNIVRGNDDEEVNVTKAPKSLMASKSLRPAAKTPEDMHRWVGILSAELHTRILNNFEDFHSWPKTLLVSFRATSDTSYRSKSCPMLNRDNLKSPDKLTQKAIDLLGPMEDVTPCVGLSLQATGLAADQSATNHSITKLFAQQQKRLPSEHIVPQKREAKEQSRNPSFLAPKKVGIMSFYSKKKEKPETSEDIDTWTCDKCYKKIPRSSIEEHTDYHFALELQQKESHRRDPPPQTAPEKKKKRLFFQPQQ